MNYSCDTTIASSSVTKETNNATCSQTEMIARMNNVGVSCMESCDMMEAEDFFQKALDKIGEITFFFENTFPKSLYRNNGSAAKNPPEEYDEGMNTFSNYFPTVSSPQTSSVESSAITILFNLGQLYTKLNKLDDAALYFSWALQIMQCSSNNSEFKTSSKRSNVTTFALLHRIGYLQYCNGEHEDAMRTYSKALIIGRELCRHQSTTHRMLDVSSTLNCLGVVSFHLAEANATEKSMELYRESLSIRRAVLGSDNMSIEVATTLNNIGRVHYMKCELDDALHYYSQALGMRRCLLGDNHLDVAATIFNAGQTFQKKGELSNALELFEEFLLIVKKHFGVEHRDVVIVLKCMAQIYHERKQLNQAKDLYKEALALGRPILGPHHSEVASILNKLGNLHYERGDYGRAIRVYKEGLAVEREILDSCHPNIIVTLTNIGQICKIQGKYSEAIRYHKEAAMMQQKSMGSSHPNVAATLSCIGLIQYQSRKFVKALDSYQEALRIRRDAFGDNHLEVATTLNSIGLVLFKMELHDLSLQSFHESLKIRRTLLGRNHRDTATILYNIATVLFDIGNDDDAMAYYNETLRVEQLALGPSHKDVVYTLLQIGHAYQQRGEFDAALEHLLEALEIQKAEMGMENADPASVSHTWNLVGNVYLQRGQTEEMVSAFSASVRLLREAGKDVDDLEICGFNFYGISKMHPECAPVA